MDGLKQRFPRYNKLLHLYPAAYRAEYQQQMLQTLADMLDDPQISTFEAWSRTTIDLPVSVVYQQIKFAGGVMVSEMPKYIKLNALIGAMLLTPFFLFIIVNSLLGHRLFHSILWHTNVIFVWLIILPAIAAVLNVGGLLRWMNDRRHGARQKTWQMLLDWRHNWPAVVAIGLGLGIIALAYGHDSVHCVTGNPIRELRNWHQTSLCIQQKTS